ncbi:hypothetical protein [Polaromonas jejuensis]|uniref:ZIP family metal transporter n=1 Tax=Polaromonas jejuensis TaxID=457502 RepID=A0ABW0QDX0_9BURK|nr:hypothetical protein [Polaromonas jejuensis]
MKLIGGGLLTGVSAGLLAAWRVHANPRNTAFLAIFLAALIGAAGLFLVSMLLPDDIAQFVQEWLGWFLAGTVAALALLVTVKGLESLLDS